MEKHDVEKIFCFYLNNNFSPNLFCRNFSENIFLNLSNSKNSLFLLLTLLTKKLNGKRESEWLLIFMKRTILFFSKSHTKLNYFKVLEAFIEIAICSRGKLYNLIEENLQIFFNLNKKKKRLEKYLSQMVVMKITEKLNFKRPFDYTESILSVCSTFVFASKDSFGDDIFDLLFWHVSDFFLIISNFNIIFIGKSQLKSLMLMEKIFRKIKTFSFCPKMSFELLINFLIIFLNIYFSTIYPYFFKKSFWSSIGNFENKYSKSVQNFNNEVVTFVPVFLTFFFLDLKTKFFYLNNSKIVFLTFIFLADSFQRVISSTLLKKLIFLVFKNLLLFKKISNSESYILLKFFSHEKKLNYIDKSLNLNRIIYSVEIKKKKSFCSFNIIDFINSFLFTTQDISEKINAFYSISFLYGNSLKGINVTRYNLNIKTELHTIAETNRTENSEKIQPHCIDLISFYRYQLSLKKMPELIKTILEKKSVLCNMKAHIFVFFERILCIRGNDGNGIQLLEINFCFLKEIFDIFNFYMKTKNFLSCSKDWFLKFLMRITSYWDETNKKNENFSNNIINMVLKNADIEKYSIHSRFYLFEIIFYIIKNQASISREFQMNIITFSQNVVLKNQIELLPHVFEIFSNFDVSQDKNFFERFFYRLFSGICNPHIWNNKILICSILKFIESFINKFSFSFSIRDIVDILKILTFLIKYYDQFGVHPFLRYFNILKSLPKLLHFLPHVFEKLNFFEKFIEFKKIQKIFLMFLFVNLTYIDFLTVEKITNKVKIDSLSFLIGKINYKDYTSLICKKFIEFSHNFYENNGFRINLKTKKLLKLITRNLVNSSWELKEFLQENFKEEKTNLRLIYPKINLAYFKKLKIFFQEMYFRLTIIQNQKNKI